MIEDLEKKLNMDDYDREAVFTPAMVNVIVMVIIVLCSFYNSSLAFMKSGWWQPIIKIAGTIAVAAVLIRFIMFITQGASKFFEDINYGRDRLHFPTTSMLLLSDNSIGQDLKKRVRRELKTLYNVRLCSKTSERANELEARKAAKDAVALIRQDVAELNDDMMQRKLKRYGAYRNFLGGALFCLPISIICWAIGLTMSMSSLASTIILILYAILAVVDYFLAKKAAVDYAENLLITFDKNNFNET